MQTAAGMIKNDTVYIYLLDIYRQLRIKQLSTHTRTCGFFDANLNLYGIFT